MEKKLNLSNDPLLNKLLKCCTMFSWDFFPMNLSCADNIKMRKDEVFPYIWVEIYTANNDGWILDRVSCKI